MVPISRFGRCVLVLAEADNVKPARWLAERGLCSVQQANRIIRGSRGVSRKAIAALVVEII